jgi:hypothetical protein
VVADALACHEACARQLFDLGQASIEQELEGAVRLDDPE